ncbi:MAG: hypothetical protein E7517_01790 [Ruminococcaceae bacterium]|nr:hypothetical protein [Oscillospiraceae bacterium]
MCYEYNVFYLSELRKALEDEYRDNMALLDCMTAEGKEDKALREIYEGYNAVIIGRIHEIKQQINTILKGERVYLILDDKSNAQEPL